MVFRRAYGLPGLPASFNNGTLFFVVDGGVGVVVVVAVVVVFVVVVLVVVVVDCGVVDTTFGSIGATILSGFFKRIPAVLALFKRN